MFNRTITPAHAGAIALWILGFTLVLLQLAGGPNTGQLGILVGCVGGVLHIRCFFTNLEEREMAAFKLGREYEQTMHMVR